MTEPDARKWKQAFAAAVRSLRQERQVSQEELAGACEITRSHMSGLERGRHGPGFLKILTLCDFFKISFSDFAKSVEYYHAHPRSAPPAGRIVGR